MLWEGKRKESWVTPEWSNVGSSFAPCPPEAGLALHRAVPCKNESGHFAAVSGW